MSRAAILIALSRVLRRQPTPEEFSTFRATLVECCPSGRVYVPQDRRSQGEQISEAANLVAAGASYRQAAKAAGLKKDRLIRALSQNPVVKRDTETA